MIKRKSGVVFATIWLCAACGASTQPPAVPAGPPDQPVPASVPRGEVHGAIDLTPRSDCEEAFDLAVYKNRGVDLITWDDLDGRCVGREVEVTYLTDRLTKQRLLELIRAHSDRFEEKSK